MALPLPLIFLCCLRTSPHWLASLWRRMAALILSEAQPTRPIFASTLSLPGKGTKTARKPLGPHFSLCTGQDPGITQASCITGLLQNHWLEERAGVLRHGRTCRPPCYVVARVVCSILHPPRLQTCFRLVSRLCLLM